eukprot:g6831.t1
MSTVEAKVATVSKDPPKARDLVAQLQLQGDEYMLKIEEEKQKIDRIEFEINEVAKREEERVKALLRNRKSVNESPKASKRKEQAVEDRLVVDIQNLNNLFSTNTNLQEKINAYRQERMKLKLFTQKLDSEMQDGKDILKGYLSKIEQQSKVNNALETDVKNLKNAILKEQKEHQAATLKLSRALSQDQIMSRNAKINLERKRKKQMVEDPGIKDREEEIRKVEIDMKRKKTQGAWKLARQRAQLKLSMVKIRKYEEAFNSILRTKNISNLDELVQTFIDSSKRDIKMVEKLSNLTLLTDQCNQEVQELWQDIDSRRTPVSKSEESVNQRIIRELEEKILRFQDHQNQYIRQFESSSAIVNSMKQAVHQISSNITYRNSREASMVESGHDKEWNNDNNMILTDLDLIKSVASIEQRLNEVIELSLNFTPKDQVHDIHILNRGPNLPAALSQSDARKNAIEKQHKIHEMEKVINNVSNNIDGTTGQKKNLIENSNTVLLEQKRKDSIPRRLTRMEIEKSLHALET